MYSTRVTILIIILLAGLIFLGGCVKLKRQSAEETDTLTMIDKAQNWAIIKEWTGQGIKQTEIFNVPEKTWKITWHTYDGDVVDDMLVGGFEIMAYREGASLGNVDSITKGDIATVAFMQRLGDGEYYMHNGPGKFYLRIASGTCKWEVKVWVGK